MVRGIGVDIIEIDRIRETVETTGDQFLQKIFTAQEVAYSLSKRDRHQHLAARYAAKEAVAKALATGWAGAFRWKDVEVFNDPAGRPMIRLHGSLKETLQSSTVLVSMSHSDTHVVAMVVIEDADQ